MFSVVFSVEDRIVIQRAIATLILSRVTLWLCINFVQQRVKCNIKILNKYKYYSFVMAVKAYTVYLI